MRVSGLSSYNALQIRNQNFKSSNIDKTTNDSSYSGINGESLKISDKNNIFSVENISDKKVGSKFILTINDPKYEGLRILVKPESKITSDDGSIFGKIQKDNISFSGRVYGSIRKNDDSSCDEKMRQAYKNYWINGMHNKVVNNYVNNELTSKIKDDYNFFIPSDGDGTRYKDIAKLQGGITKPASFLPSTLNGQQMSLVQSVLTNFSRTNKLDDGVGFVEVEPAQGSAFAFLEGLKDGTIPTDKPLVFSWGDNFSDIDVTKLILEHEKKNSGMTIMSILCDDKQIKSLGALEVDSKDNMEVKRFKEKPTNDTEIESFKEPGFDNQCIASVGPYILSKEVLTRIKNDYISNPEAFLNTDGKGYDFSSMIISPMVDLLGSGEITDKNGEALKLRTTVLPSGNTWSDLGAEKDFTTSMLSIKGGGYSNLPREIIDSITNNVDENNNITFGDKEKELVASLKNDYGINLENTVVYFKK